MLVPSDTPSGLLWVEVATTALFKGLLHVNAARKLTAEHLMRWQQPFLRYLWISIPLVSSWCTFPLMEFPRRSLWTKGHAFSPCFTYPRRHSSLEYFPQPFHLQHTQETLNLTPSLPFIRPRIIPRSRPRPKAQGLIYNLGPHPFT